MIHIALSLHDKTGQYWPYVVITLSSVFAHSSRKLHVHLLHDEALCIDARQTLVGLCTKHQHALSFHWVELPQEMQSINFGLFSPASIYRLTLPQLLKHLDWVIYLDADIIFNQVDIADLAAAIENDPEQRPLAAVHDRFFAAHASQRQELEYIGVHAAEYINSGVLGIRPAQINIDLIDALRDFVTEYPQARHHDQDLLNVMFRHQILRLPELFNFQVNLMQGSCFEDLSHYAHKVLHYCGKAKPLSGTFSPADVFFWRYTQDVPNIHRFVQAPMRYLQKMRDKPNGARLISTHEGAADALPPVQWLSTAETQSQLAAIAKDQRISLRNNTTWEASQADVRAGKASGTVWSAPHFEARDFHLASRLHEWWQHHPRCVLRDAQGHALLVAQHGVSDEPLAYILNNSPSNGEATWDVQGHHSSATQPSPLLIVTATRESGERFFTHTALGKSITQLRAQGVKLQVHAATNNRKPIGEVYNGRVQEQWANHIIVFVHDDVRFDDQYLAHRLHDALARYDVVGVAGNRRRYAGQPAWHRPRFLSQGGPKDDLMGSVSHDTRHLAHAHKRMQVLSRFGESTGAAQLLDGVFIAARGRTLLDSGVRFDAALGFHFYDLDFCRAATQAGLRLGVWPIAMTHFSIGGYDSDAWTAAYKQYLAKWGEDAPQQFA